MLKDYQHQSGKNILILELYVEIDTSYPEFKKQRLTS